MYSEAETESPFLFVGGALALDFVNTEIVERGKRSDLLQTPDDLVQWWRLAAAEYDIPDESAKLQVDAEIVEEVRQFRVVLLRFFERLAVHSEVDTDALIAINSVLQQGYRGLQFTPDKGFQIAYHGETPLTQWCLPLALSAAELLTMYDPARLHKCHNDRCVLLFYDTTKSGTRQWCSLACLERERSSRRYRERKAERHDTP